EHRSTEAQRDVAKRLEDMFPEQFRAYMYRQCYFDDWEFKYEWLLDLFWPRENGPLRIGRLAGVHVIALDRDPSPALPLIGQLPALRCLTIVGESVPFAKGARAALEVHANVEQLSLGRMQ